MRESGFILSKQVLIVFLVFFLVAGAFMGTPIGAQTAAGGSPPPLQAGSGDSWSKVSTSPTPTARYGHAMAATPATPAGVLLFGGLNWTTFFNDTWLFDVLTNT